MFFILIYAIKMNRKNDAPAHLAQLAGGAAEYTNSISEEKTPPMSVLDMTLNSLMLRLQGMQSTPSLPSLPGPLWPIMKAPDSILFMGHIELFDI